MGNKRIDAPIKLTELNEQVVVVTLATFAIGFATAKTQRTTMRMTRDTEFEFPAT